MAVVRDSDGVEVKPGDVVHFGYGIPGVGVDAPVIDRDGVLMALTPDHNPKECRVDRLERYVGHFYVVKTKRVSRQSEGGRCCATKGHTRQVDHSPLSQRNR